MVNVITEVLIAAPISRVASYVKDPDNAPEWYENIKSVEWKSEKPLRIGSRMAFVAHFLGRKLSYTYEVTELSDNKMIMRTSEGPFPMETIYTWEMVNNQTTQMTLTNRGDPKGFSKVFSPFMSFMMRKANQKDLMRLKSILEQNEKIV